MFHRTTMREQEINRQNSLGITHPKLKSLSVLVMNLHSLNSSKFKHFTYDMYIKRTQYQRTTKYNIGTNTYASFCDKKMYNIKSYQLGTQFSVWDLAKLNQFGILQNWITRKRQEGIVITKIWFRENRLASDSHFVLRPWCSILTSSSGNRKHLNKSPFSNRKISLCTIHLIPFGSRVKFSTLK